MDLISSNLFPIMPLRLNTLVVLTLNTMYKNSKIKLVPRLIVVFITIGLLFYDKTLAGYFIFSAIIIMGIFDFIMNKLQKM